MPSETPESWTGVRQPDPEFLPLTHLIINGHQIPADLLAGGQIHHDVSAGTVTVTFVDVRTVETLYRHQEARDAVRP